MHTIFSRLLCCSFILDAVKNSEKHINSKDVALAGRDRTSILIVKYICTGARSMAIRCACMVIISKILLKLLFFLKLKYLPVLITLHFLQHLVHVLAFIVVLVIFKD